MMEEGMPKVVGVRVTALLPLPDSVTAAGGGGGGGGSRLADG